MLRLKPYLARDKSASPEPAPSLSPPTGVPPKRSLSQPGERKLGQLPGHVKAGEDSQKEVKLGLVLLSCVIILVPELAYSHCTPIVVQKKDLTNFDL